MSDAQTESHPSKISNNWVSPTEVSPAQANLSWYRSPNAIPISGGGGDYVMRLGLIFRWWTYSCVEYFFHCDVCGKSCTSRS